MSNLQSIPFERLLESCRTAFKSFGVSDHCIGDHMLRVKHLAEFMDKERIQEYTPEVGKRYVAYLQSSPLYSDYRKRTDKRTVKYIDMYLKGEPYKRYIKEIRLYRCSDTDLGKLGNEYVASLPARGLSAASQRRYRYGMYLFTSYMDESGVSATDLARHNVLDFISTRQACRKEIATVVRGFLTFLYEKGITEKDLTHCLRNTEDVRHDPIISYYTPEEIGKIEQTVNRMTRNGKRNYAMILLATRLGLRSSDIVNLEFSNIDWDNNTISVNQKKTQKALVLPLLADVGDAIIDYVMNGRPKSDEKKIFLSTNRPYTPLLSLGVIVYRYILQADIHIPTIRRKGSHSLRHSLATAMMNTGAEIPVISEVLGHSTSESTQTYLGVNVPALIECSMDVPTVDTQFYNQKGGAFYE